MDNQNEIHLKKNCTLTATKRFDNFNCFRKVHWKYLSLKPLDLVTKENVVYVNAYFRHFIHIIGILPDVMIQGNRTIKVDIFYYYCKFI